MQDSGRCQALPPASRLDVFRAMVELSTSLRSQLPGRPPQLYPRVKGDVSIYPGASQLAETVGVAKEKDATPYVLFLPVSKSSVLRRSIEAAEEGLLDTVPYSQLGTAASASTGGWYVV